MSIILKGQASWYSATDKGGNDNVAMMSARKCPTCKGYGNLKLVPSVNLTEEGLKVLKCDRCKGDGKLINQMPFNPQGSECAIPLSLIEKHGLRFGQLVIVRYKCARIHAEISITVRLVDIGPSEKLCAEGRIIDLTEFAFSQLEDTSKGIIEIELEAL